MKKDNVFLFHPLQRTARVMVGSVTVMQGVTAGAAYVTLVTKETGSGVTVRKTLVKLLIVWQRYFARASVAS